MSAGIPAGTTTFRLWRMTPNLDPKSNRPSRWRQEKLLGPPDAQGKSVDRWPVKLFNLAAICNAHGSGRYRVEWLDAKETKLGQETFEVQAAPQQPPAPAPHAPSGGPAVGTAIQGPDGRPMDAWGFMAMLDQREQAALARAREEASAQRERDREFATSILGARLTAPAGTAVAGGALDARELDIVKREMRLEAREQLAKMREELRAEFDAQGGDDDADPNYKPPKSVGEAASRVGIKLIQELEEQAPELLQSAIPAIITKLKAAGFTPSKELQSEVRKAMTNGTPVTDDDFEEAAGSVEH